MAADVIKIEDFIKKIPLTVSGSCVDEKHEQIRSDIDYLIGTMEPQLREVFCRFWNEAVIPSLENNNKVNERAIKVAEEAVKFGKRANQGAEQAIKAGLKSEHYTKIAIEVAERAVKAVEQLIKEKDD